MKKEILKNKKVFFITVAFPPNPSAAASVHKFLFKYFDEDSYVILTAKMHFAKKTTKSSLKNLYFIWHNFEFLSQKIDRYFSKIQKLYLRFILNYYYKKFKPVLIIGAYPDINFLKIAFEFAKSKKLPFLPYLHDTVYEANLYKPNSDEIKKLHEDILSYSKQIAVMSEGMEDLYKEKYNRDTVALEHIYPEKPVLNNNLIKKERIHWSGDIYIINQNSVKRFSDMLNKLNYEFTISNGKTIDNLKEMGITGNIRKCFYEKRTDYLNHLSESKYLLLSLDYPEDSPVHKDELRTIFSTKTPEYLGSGSLIIYHGPSDYFLAKFINKYDCGIVIDTKDEKLLLEKFSEIDNNYDRFNYKILNAYNCLKIFDGETISNKLIKLSEKSVWN